MPACGCHTQVSSNVRPQHPKYKESNLKQVIASLLAASSLLVACTHAAVSSVPMEIPGVGTVYRYQGRANFSHQMAEADRMMQSECERINGGVPVVVSQQMRDLGMVAINNSQYNASINGTGQRVGNTTYVNGNLFGSSTGTTSAMRNMNQEILFKCVALSAPNPPAQSASIPEQ